MNTKPTPPLPELDEQDVQRLAQQLRPHLDARADALDPRIAQRLQIARRAALASLELAEQRDAHLNADGSLSLSSSWAQRLRDWRFWACGLFVATLLGLYGAQEWRNNAQYRDALDLELLLLADELPPDAYLDRGFQAFLHNPS